MIHAFEDAIFNGYLEPEEHVHYVGHKHPILLAKSLFVFSLIGVGIPWYLYASNPDLLWVSITIAGIGLLRFSLDFVIWFFDCWVVTNKGVIDIQWESLFNRKNIRFAYDNFEGISTEINGFWNTLLRKGDVMLIRLVDTNQVLLTETLRPNRLENKVLEAKTNYHHHVNETRMKKQEFVSGVITDMVKEYADRNGIDLR